MPYVIIGKLDVMQTTDIDGFYFCFPQLLYVANMQQEVAFDVNVCKCGMCHLSVFRHFHKTAKNGYELRLVCPSACLSVWNNSANTGRIFLELDI